MSSLEERLLRLEARVTGLEAENTVLRGQPWLHAPREAFATPEAALGAAHGDAIATRSTPSCARDLPVAGGERHAPLGHEQGRGEQASGEPGERFSSRRKLRSNAHLAFPPFSQSPAGDHIGNARG